MAFIPANIQPLPKHNTYAGALVGGARQAAQNVGGIIEHAIKPDGEPTCPGMRPRTISQRLSGLTRIPESVSISLARKVSVACDLSIGLAILVFY